MKLLFLLSLSLLVAGCTSGTYKRAINNYSGDTDVEETNYCSVSTITTKSDVERAFDYIRENNLEYMGSTCFEGKPNFREKHAEKLCQKLGGDHILLLRGDFKYYTSEYDFTTYDTRTANVSTRSNTSYYGSNSGYLGKSDSYVTGTVTYDVPETHHYTSTTKRQEFCAYLYREAY